MKNVHTDMSPGIYEIGADPSWFKMIFDVLKSVCYTDTPIILTIIFHFVIFSTLLRNRKKIIISSFLFGALCFLIVLTPKINSYLMESWDKMHFSVNYFDESCIFMFLFWTMPLMMTAIVMLMIMVFEITIQFITRRKTRRR